MKCRVQFINLTSLNYSKNDYYENMLNILYNSKFDVHVFCNKWEKLYILFEIIFRRIFLKLNKVFLESALVLNFRVSSINKSDKKFLQFYNFVIIRSVLFVICNKICNTSDVKFSLKLNYIDQLVIIKVSYNNILWKANFFFKVLICQFNFNSCCSSLCND